MEGVAMREGTWACGNDRKGVVFSGGCRCEKVNTKLLISNLKILDDGIKNQNPCKWL